LEFGEECFEKTEANFLNTQFPASGASSLSMTDAETDNPKVLTAETISLSDTIN